MAYRAETTVNWCPALGTVLANDEVKDGKSERGGYPVFQKKMMQWSMRITAYSERLLNGLKTLDWPQPLKDSQEYWIGKSQGASVKFRVPSSEFRVDETDIEVFTTRPDTIFGATFMVLAPENPLVEKLTTPEQKAEVDHYIEETSKKTERDRMADVKSVSGSFTGSFANNPFTDKKIPIYISDYVLMGYGTGAVMAVPAHDERDHRFAKKFGLEIINVIKNDNDIQEESYDSKDSVCVNSDFLDGLKYDEAKKLIIEKIVEKGIGFGTTNYKQRDAIFSRQRYWGEPVPVYYKEGMPYTLPVSALPLELPEVEKYLPTEDGDPPLGNAKNFAWDETNQKVVSVDLIDEKTIFPMELSTMPGWAGSSWYFLRYMDPENSGEFVAKDLSDYWGQVDLYIGGSEHATGHLLYSRFWNMFLKDRGYINQDEPFQKLINQGMILGNSAKFIKLLLKFKFENVDDLRQSIGITSPRIVSSKLYLSLNDDELKSLFKSKFKSFDLIKFYDFDLKFTLLNVDISLINETTNTLNINEFINDVKYKDEYYGAEILMDNGEIYNVNSPDNSNFHIVREVEKMSKSKYNVVNPDDIADEFGADCLRLYEMFLGPLEQSKPWNTQGLSGVYGFLKKFYNLYFDGDTKSVSDEEPTKEEYKILHALIKKVLFDLEHFSFNTSVSQFMIAVNELQKLKCNKRAILEPLAILVSPYAPHICEELWSLCNHDSSIEFEAFPTLDESYLVEDEIDYPVSFNGKMKFKLKLPANLSVQEIQELVIKDSKVQENLSGNEPKKVIIVPNKVINFVI